MGARWRRVAEKLANRAFEPGEISEAIDDVVRAAFPTESITALKAILDPPGQGRLFDEDRDAALDAIAQGRPGCIATIALVECAIDACSRSSTPREALASAVSDAAREVFDARARSIEEHYGREAGARSGTFMRERCDALRTACDFDAVASRLLSGDGRRPPSRPRNGTGLEDGPALSS